MIRMSSKPNKLRNVDKRQNGERNHHTKNYYVKNHYSYNYERPFAIAVAKPGPNYVTFTCTCTLKKIKFS